MSAIEMETKVNELRELKRMQDELAGEIAALEDSIKAHMAASGTEEVSGTSFKITWHEVTSRRLDSKALKAAAPTIWEQFSKPTTSRRFILA